MPAKHWEESLMRSCMPTVKPPGSCMCRDIRVFKEWYVYIYIYYINIYIYIPGTCLSFVLRVEPSKRRYFPIKARVICVPGIYTFFMYCYFYEKDYS